MKRIIQTIEDEKPQEKVTCPQCGTTLFWANKCDVQILCKRCKNIIKVTSE